MNRSKITWLVNPDGSQGYTWGVTSGCSPVSAGCANCWAKAYHVRYRGGDFTPKIHPEKLDEPLRLRKPSTIFVSPMGDIAHEAIHADFVREVLNIAWAAESKGHTMIFLTKRPARLRYLLAEWRRGNMGLTGKPFGWWLGVSVEDQATADARIPILLDTPAAHRWVSYEPALGPVDFSRWLTKWPFGPDGPQTAALDGIIIGCESGPRRRPFDVAWARSVRDQCKAAGVPYYLKQMPTRQTPSNSVWEKPLLDGRQHLDLPWAAVEGGR